MSVNKGRILFSIADDEVQKRLGLKTVDNALDILGINLKICSLLADYVDHSASYFFESSLTFDLFVRHQEIFAAGNHCIWINKNAGDIYGHIAKKRRFAPARENHYEKERAKRIMNQLNVSAQQRLRNESISSAIDELWIQDTFGSPNEASKVVGIVGTQMDSDTKKTKNILSELRSIPKRRLPLEFVPSVLNKHAKRLKLPPSVLNQLQTRLSLLYENATGISLNSYVPESQDWILEENRLPRLDPLSPKLFKHVLKGLDIYYQLFSLNDKGFELIRNKMEMRRFIAFYHQAVIRAKNLLSFERMLNRKKLFDSGKLFYLSNEKIIYSCFLLAILLSVGVNIATPVVAFGYAAFEKILKKICKFDSHSMADLLKLFEIEFENQLVSRSG